MKKYYTTFERYNSPFPLSLHKQANHLRNHQLMFKGGD